MRAIRATSRRLYVRGKRLALDAVACLQKCCQQAPPQLWNQAFLCDPSHQPADIPRVITFLDGFKCDSCDLNGDRIIIFRDHCYQVQADVLGRMFDCNGTTLKKREISIYPYPGATVANWSELVCKPLEATCADPQCVVQLPGCCCPDSTGPCPDQPDNSICKRPKRYRITRDASYLVRSWAIVDGYRICEDVSLTAHFDAEFQCIENTNPVQVELKAFSGRVTATGYDPSPRGGINWNGTRTYTLQDALDYGHGGFEGLGDPLPFKSGFVLYLYNNLPRPFGTIVNCTGYHDPAYGDSNCITDVSTCVGGRRSRTVRGNCRNGSISHGEYQDCNTRMLQHNSIGNYSAPFSGQAWLETASDMTTITNLLGCPVQTNQLPIPSNVAQAFRQVIATRTTGEVL